MAELTTEMKDDIRMIIFDFLAEACELDRTILNDDMNIINDLGADSLMFLELLEVIKKKYGFELDLQVIGQYLLNKPPRTIGDIIGLSYLLYEHGSDILEV